MFYISDIEKNVILPGQDAVREPTCLSVAINYLVLFDAYKVLYMVREVVKY